MPPFTRLNFDDFNDDDDGNNGNFSSPVSMFIPIAASWKRYNYYVCISDENTESWRVEILDL